jgi:hypothetical protein
LFTDIEGSTSLSRTLGPAAPVGQIHRMLGNYEASRAAYLEALT